MDHPQHRSWQAEAHTVGVEELGCRRAKLDWAIEQTISVSSTNQRPFRISRKSLLLPSGGIALVVLAMSRWDPVGPQSLICQHRDDPKGEINFRVDVGRGKDQVRFADGQTLPVETSRDQITFLEKETNRFHLADNDADDATWQQPGQDISGGKGSVVLNFDLHHDEEHRTTIDRHRLTFREESLIKEGRPAEVMMTGRCRLVDGPSAKAEDTFPSRPLPSPAS